MADPEPKPHPEDDAAFRQTVETGLRSLDQGRRVPYDKVRKWLLSWGSDREEPPPECE